MAELTRTTMAILDGLVRGGQPGLADLVRRAVEDLLPPSPDQRRPKRDPEEDRRQAAEADEVVTRAVKAQISERRQIQDLIGGFDLTRIETIIGDGPGEGGRTIDVLSDPRAVEALETFLDAWRREIDPLREGPILKQ